MAQNFLSDIKLGDNIYIRLGDATNGDLQIYHNGTNNFIKSGTVGLYVQGDYPRIQSSTGENYFVANPNAEVSLYYDNSKKLETANTGIVVTGNADPATDSLYDLGTDTVRWANVYADTLHGDGSNITGVAADKSQAVTLTVKNKSGGSLSKGTIVHAHPSVSPPSGNVIEVIAADNDDTTKMPAIGILNATLADEAEGEAIMFGRVSGISTTDDGTSTGTLFSIGDELYVSSTPGLFTNVKPTGTKLIQKIAVVIKSHATNGTIEVFGAGRTNDVPTPIYIDHANQRVGIGETSPSRKLHLTGGDFYTPDKSDTIGAATGYGGNSFQIRNGSTSEDLNFDIFNRTTSAWYTPMVIKNTGNVGIASTDVQKNLSIGNAQGDGIQFNYDTTNNYRNQILNYWNSNTDTRMDFNIARTSGQTPETIMSVGYNSNVGIGTTSPTGKLNIEGAGNHLHLRANTATAGKYWNFDITSANQLYIINNGGTGMTIKDTGEVGIGTASPSFKLDINAGSNAGVFLTGSADARYHVFSSSTADWVGYELRSSNVNSFAGGIFRNNTDNDRVSLYNKTTEAISLKDGGNVGIGTSSPDVKTHIFGGSDSQENVLLKVQSNGVANDSSLSTSILLANSTALTSIHGAKISAIRTGTSTDDLTFSVYSTTMQERMRIASDGTTTIKTDGATQLILNRADSSIFADNTIGTIQATADDPTASQLGGQIQFTGGGTWSANNYPTNIVFSNDSSGTLTERMRVVSDGKVFIGKTSTGLANIGVEFDPTGQLKGTASNVVVQYLNRTSSDGAILEFRKDNSAVGSIGSTTSYLNSSLGIGETNPSAKLEVKGTAGLMLLKTSTGNAFYVEDDTNYAKAYLYQIGGGVKIQLNTNGDSYFNGGNVGIGVTSPGHKLDVSGNIRLQGGNRKIIYNNGSVETSLDQVAGATAGLFTLGNVGIGTATPSNKVHIYASDGSSYLRFTSDVATTGSRIGLNSDDLIIENQQASGDMIFDTNSTERMRIASDGSTTFAGAITTNANNTFKSAAGSGQGIELNLIGTNTSGFGSSHVVRSRIKTITDNSGNAYASKLEFYTNDASNNLDLALKLDSSQKATFTGDVQIDGDLIVTGATTSVNVEDLNVEQGEITLNYGTGDTSAAANGAGIRIQDAVNATTDATILWDATNDEFDFSHGITSQAIKVDQTGSNAGLHIGRSDMTSSNFATTNNAIFFGDELPSGNYRHQASISAVREAWSNSPTSLVFKTSATVNGATTALTLDSSQDATFEGDVNVKNASTRFISLNYEDSVNTIKSHAGSPNFGIESLNIKGDIIRFYTDYDANSLNGDLTLTLDNNHNATFTGSIYANTIYSNTNSTYYIDVVAGGTGLNMAGSATFEGDITAPGQYGESYSVDSTSGTVAIIDTLTLTATDHHAVYEVVAVGNPNNNGSGFYRDIIFGKIIVSHGYTNPNVLRYIHFVRESPLPRDMNGSGTINNLTMEVVFWDGSSESETFTSNSGTPTIRVKIDGYAGTVGSNTSVRLKRIM